MEITLANVISVAIPLAALFIAWGKISSKVEAMKSDVEDLQQSDKSHDRRLRTVEQDGVRHDERFNLILQTLAELKQELKTAFRNTSS